MRGNQDKDQITIDENELENHLKQMALQESGQTPTVNFVQPVPTTNQPSAYFDYDPFNTMPESQTAGKPPRTETQVVHVNEEIGDLISLESNEAIKRKQEKELFSIPYDPNQQPTVQVTPQKNANPFMHYASGQNAHNPNNMNELVKQKMETYSQKKSNPFALQADDQQF